MIKITPLGGKVFIEINDQKGFSADKDEIDFIQESSSQVSLNVGGFPIPVTDFQIDGVSVTDLADFKSKWATVFPNAGGSATQTLDEVLETGATLTEDRTIELDSNILKVSQQGQALLHIDHSGNNVFLRNNPAQVPSSAIIDLNNGQLILTAHDNSGGTTHIDMDGLNNNIRYAAGAHIFEGIQEFADNAAALAGGVLGGGLYCTTVSGERIVKIAIA